MAKKKSEALEALENARHEIYARAQALTWEKWGSSYPYTEKGELCLLADMKADRPNDKELDKSIVDFVLKHFSESKRFHK